MRTILNKVSGLIEFIDQKTSDRLNFHILERVILEAQFRYPHH
jgi:hypothetical protein